MNILDAIGMVRANLRHWKAAESVENQAHPRYPAGSSHGGEFMSKGGGGIASEISKAERGRFRVGDRANAEKGAVREEKIRAKLAEKYPEPPHEIHSQVYLIDERGKRLLDPKTGKARRVDFVVALGKKAIKSVEVTSKTADKSSQMARERRLRQENTKVYGLIRGGKAKIWMPASAKTQVIRVRASD